MAARAAARAARPLSADDDDDWALEPSAHSPPHDLEAAPNSEWRDVGAALCGGHSDDGRERRRRSRARRKMGGRTLGRLGARDASRRGRRLTAPQLVRDAAPARRPALGSAGRRARPAPADAARDGGRARVLRAGEGGGPNLRRAPRMPEQTPLSRRAALPPSQIAPRRRRRVRGPAPTRARGRRLPRRASPLSGREARSCLASDPRRRAGQLRRGARSRRRRAPRGQPRAQRVALRRAREERRRCGARSL